MFRTHPTPKLCARNILVENAQSSCMCSNTNDTVVDRPCLALSAVGNAMHV